MKKKLYIGCSLTHLPAHEKEVFLEMISDLRRELEKNFEILDFLGKGQASTATPEEVYSFDIKTQVLQADCVLAVCDHPSLGLGYEIATAVERKGIPVLAVAHKSRTVSRLIQGVDHENFNFFYYESVEEIIQKALEILTK
ncbi:MAG TPA: hypothetical protein VJH06_04180 [Candidatus Paceibacterota bacterium]